MHSLPSLTTRHLGRTLVYLEEVDSTNNYLKNQTTRLAHGAVALARRQTGGRGRLGRQWVDTNACALPFSVLLRDWPQRHLTALPFVAGMAVCRGLEALCGQTFALKWSNDVLWERKKICGILCESRVAGTHTDAIVGIGVNVRHTAEDFQSLNLVYATSLFLATVKYFEMSTICAAILNEMEPLLDICSENGFPALREEYKKRCVNLGRQVQITRGGTQQRGVCLDVAEDGSLVCDIGGKTVSIFAGEASVRGLWDYV